jgi:hypothetical protein
VRIFGLAATEYAVVAGPVERWRVQREKKARAYALIEKLKHATTDADADAISRREPAAARAALLPG